MCSLRADQVNITAIREGTLLESIKDVDIKKPPVALSGIDVRDIKSGIYKRRWDLKYMNILT